MADSDSFITCKMNNFAKYLETTVINHCDNKNLLITHAKLLTVLPPSMCIKWLTLNMTGKTVEQVYQRLNEEYVFLDDTCKERLIKYIEMFQDIASRV